MSQTSTAHVLTEPSPSSSTSQPEAPGPEVLTLRLVPRRKKKGVKWAEDVVDNEHMNKKKSKQCCIFHKQRTFGDWSDDEGGGGEENEDPEAGPCECPQEG